MPRLSSLLAVFAALAVAGCTTFVATADYQCALTEINRPDKVVERYGPIDSIVPEPESKYKYEDDMCAGEFFVADSRIYFSLKNKTDHSIRIIWDEAAYIDVDGEAGRVAHHGVKYTDSYVSQPPSVIPAHQNLTDFIVPADNAFLDIGGWEETPLLAPSSRSLRKGDKVAARAFANEVRENKGKRFGVLLPLEIEDVVNEYTFWFEVEHIVLKIH